MKVCNNINKTTVCHPCQQEVLCGSIHCGLGSGQEQRL